MRHEYAIISKLFIELRRLHSLFVTLLTFALASGQLIHADPPYTVIQPAGSMILDTTDLAQCVADFNEEDRWFFGVPTDLDVSAINNGVYGGQHVLNGDSYDYLKDKIPLFDCPDPDFVKTYYFRWWTYRKHIKNLGTPGSPDFIITEYIDPVNWADSTNAINAPLGHQIYEGRWLQDSQVMSDYQRYWMNNSAARPRKYSAWLADAVLASHRVNPDGSLLAELLTSTTNIDNLETNYNKWVNGVQTAGGASRRSDGLFYQNSGYDAMENSFGSSGKRPSINSYMYAEARAIAEMFRIAAQDDPVNAATYNAKADTFDQQADDLRNEVQSHLWDPTDEFFKTGYDNFDSTGTLQARREQIGFTPWAFGLPEDGGAVDYDQAWSHLGSFATPVGLTSGAFDETGYNTGMVGQCCRWDGPVWPFASTITLRALANLLHDYQQGYVDKSDYFNQLEIYTDSHRQEFTQDGQTRTISWIDESMISGGASAGNWTQIGINLDGTSGNDNPRGLAYNHSGYVDLIITGLMGLRPANDGLVRVAPLVPDNTWDWFLLDNVLYHGRYLTILWDKTGTKYGQGAGLKVYADGNLIASANNIEEVLGSLATTPDTLIASTNPPDSAVNIPVTTTQLIATFNRPVQIGTGDIDLMQSTGGGDVLVESFDVTTSSGISFDGATLTITPSASLTAASDYYVLIDSTAIEGDSGTFFAGIADPATWNFSTDGTAPVITARVPSTGASAEPIRRDLHMTFDEPVVKGTGNIVVRLSSNDSPVQTINVTSSDVIIDEKVVTVVLADLPVDTLYVEIDSGTFTDISGNPFAGVSGGAAWSFTTSATAGIITATLLDEETDIINTGGAIVSACHFQDPTAGDPSPLVVNGIPHTVGRNNVTNLTHNLNFEGDFRNGASNLPQGGGNIVQVLLSGIAGANGINMSISGLIPGREYLFQAYWEANNTTPQHSLVVNLENDSLEGVSPQGIPGGVLISYQFTAGDDTLNAFIDRDDPDAAGGGNNWLSGYSLQAVASGGPALVSTTPADDSTNAATDGNLVATFDGLVQAGSGNISIYKSDDTLVETIAVTDTTAPGTVAISGSQAIITPSASLEPGVSYYILIDSTAITDLALEPYVGISDKTAWSFTTANPIGTITVSTLDEEIDIINTGGPLISAANFGNGEEITVNGITHAAGSGGGVNFTDNFGFEGDFRNNASGLPDGTPVNEILDGIAGANGIIMSISGLVVGREYLFQTYWEQNPGVTLTVMMEGVDILNAIPDQVPATLISYQFTAVDDTLNIDIDRDDALGGDPNNWLSGYSLQEVPPNFGTWIDGYPAVGAQTGFTDDPDGDQLSNGLEAFLGTDPGTYTPGLSGLMTDGTSTTFSHPQNTNPLSDVTGYYEWSMNLTDWYAGDGVDGPGGGPTVNIGASTTGPTTNVNATSSTPLDRLYLRLVAIQE